MPKVVHRTDNVTSVANVTKKYIYWHGLCSLSLSLSGRCPAKVIRHHSAEARCFHLDDVLMINYGGPITQQTFHALDGATSPLRMAARVALERMDSALTMCGGAVVGDAGWPPGTPPSAVIVRDDQYQQSLDFCARLADRGILRLTFLPHQEEHARWWALSTQAAS